MDETNEEKKQQQINKNVSKLVIIFTIQKFNTFSEVPF